MVWYPKAVSHSSSVLCDICSKTVFSNVTHTIKFYLKGHRFIVQRYNAFILFSVLNIICIEEPVRISENDACHVMHVTALWGPYRGLLSLSVPALLRHSRSLTGYEDKFIAMKYLKTQK